MVVSGLMMTVGLAGNASSGTTTSALDIKGFNSEATTVAGTSCIERKLDSF